MNRRDLEPLPSEVGAMLESLKPIDAVPIEMRTRLRSRVLVTVGGGPSGGGSKAAASAAVPTSPWLWLAAGVGLGLTIGLAVYSIASSGDGESAAAPAVLDSIERGDPNAASEVEQPRPPPVEAASSHAEPAREVAPRLEATAREIAPAPTQRAREAAPVPEPVVTARERDEIAPPVAREDSSTRAEQRALVERARSALAGGRIPDAMGALDEHDRRFAGGPYAEESAALRARVLLAGGRRDEAREHARRFLERYPNSIFRDLLGPALRE